MTGLVLGIESSTYLASCALFAGDDAAAIGEEEAPTRGAAGEQLLPAIDRLLRRTGRRPRDITRVVCGAGPGSFTSLRVGAALAKGLARAIGVPIAAAPSLPLLVQSGVDPAPPGRYLAVMDAMRDERFVQGCEVGVDRRLTTLAAPQRMPAGAVREYAATLHAAIVGPGDGAAIALHPHARGIMRLPPALIPDVDLSGWEPDYGRLAEAQVKWEAAHGRPLGAG